MYVNVKQKQTEGYRKQNSGYQKERERRRDRFEV